MVGGTWGRYVAGASKQGGCQNTKLEWSWGQSTGLVALV